MLRIKAVRIEVDTGDGLYGYATTFTNGLNIIRGNNTTGKSTLINAITYSLGMEELLGSRNEKALPYVLRTSLIEEPANTERIIVSSRILTEISNEDDETVTLRRSIVSATKNPKLIEIIQGPYLTKGGDSYRVVPTYVHDPGSAESEDAGFFRYLESFLGYELPYVPNSTGGETKLYLQTLFAAVIIEQKSGWTDYIANIPFFRIKNAHQKVFEFLAGLEVFENERLRNEINSSLKKISQSWNEQFSALNSLARSYAIRLSGIPTKASSDFNPDLVAVDKLTDGGYLELSLYLSQLIGKHIDLEKSAKQKRESSIMPDKIKEYESMLSEISRLTLLFRESDNEIRVNTQSIQELERSLSVIKKDIEKNRSILKLRKLGFDLGMNLAKDTCPTCHQHVSDSLIQSDDQYVMSIEENVDYLSSQAKMIERHCNAKREIIERSVAQKNRISSEIEKQRSIVESVKISLTTTDDAGQEANVRQKINIENEIKELQEFISTLESSKDAFSGLCQDYVEQKERQLKLPKDYLSTSDREKIGLFQEYFGRLAKEFDFKSTAIDKIVIDEEKYVPFMSGDVIRRDVRSNLYFDSTQKTKLKSDSSASDFVRLIWAYLISLFLVSTHEGIGHHPSILVLDEPGQHSMAVESLHVLFSNLGKQIGLQAIVAASFDESEEVFNMATKDVESNIINIMPKLIRKLEL